MRPTLYWVRLLKEAQVMRHPRPLIERRVRWFDTICFRLQIRRTKDRLERSDALFQCVLPRSCRSRRNLPASGRAVDARVTRIVVV